MKLIVCFAALFAVALGASRLHHVNNQRWLNDVEPFRANKHIQFRYDSQIVSGLGNAEQSSAHRISSSVHVTFETDRVAVLQMKNIRFGALNKQLDEPTRLYEVRLFDNQNIDTEVLEQLEMPLKFDYVNGVVERVYFNSKESSWTKNIKRAVLNMLQLNLKGRDTTYETYSDSRINDDDTTFEPKMFTVPELTLEGECQSIYTINRATKDSEETRGVFNVTKSINFDNCKKLALIRYGPRSQKPTHESKQQEIDSRQVDRSTVFRYQLVGTPEEFAVGYVQLVSQYSYRILDAEPLRTVVLNELTLEKVETSSRKSLKVSTNKRDESLMYSMEFDEQEKRFYQLGDEEFTRESSPFSKINKVQIIKDLIKKIAVHSTDKVNGITNETPLKVQELVEIIRMCSIPELKQVYEHVSGNKVELNVFYDTLGVAGTYNTIYFITEAALKEEITPAKTVQILQQLHSIPAPSSKQVKKLITLCQSNVAERSVALRQACWLVSGSLVGDLCKYSVYDSEKLLDEQCPRDVKEDFLRVFVKELKRTDSQFEKIVLLKTLGNAAIDLSIFDLERIIVDRRESTIVRQHAIDSLRRLRNEMPRKIQRILLPVFKNSQEKPELRMTAFAMIMYTMPDKAVLDQITYVLLNERSQHVRSFVYTMIVKLSESPVLREQELARDLKACLRVVKIDERDMKSSRFYRIPIYSENREEGLLFNFATIFSNTNMLPEHLSFSLDAIFNGLLERNNMEVSFTQTDIEHLYEKFYNALMTSQRSLRGNRRSRESGRDLLENVFESLKIQARQQYNSEDRTPYSMLCLRIRDVDFIVMPFSEETMPEIFRNIINGEKPSWSTIMKLLEGVKSRFNMVASLHERVVKIATSAGLPIRMTNVLPVVASIESEIKAKYTAGEIKTTIKVHPMISGAHSIKMELWCPMINTGVESLRHFEMNLPLETETMINMWNEKTEKMLLKVKLPENKLSLITLASLPITFTRHFDSRIQLHREPRVKVIRNPLMDSRIVEFSSETPRTISFNGLLHKPSELTYEQIVVLSTVTENYMTVDFEPLPESPKELHFILSGNLFRRMEESTHRPRFDSFYTSKKFESMEEDDLDNVSVESDYTREEKLNKYMNKYESRQVYDHTLKAEVKTVGGRHEKRAVLELSGKCDNKMTYCTLLTNIKRSPIFEHENSEWTMTGKCQVLLPERVNKIEQLSDNEHNRIVMTLESEWGMERIERMSVKIQGERVVPEQWTRREWRRELISAFLNKYDLVAEYELNEVTQKRFSRFFEYFKILNTWNMDMEKEINGRDNHVFLTTIIDPRTRQHLNVTIKTPTEVTRFTNIELPFTFKPYNLIRQNNNEVRLDSMTDVFDQLSEVTRDDCRVDGHRIRTFDDILYKAPLHQCYSVIAKDCSDRKSFVVMMKKIEENTNEKKIKIVNDETIIEVELVNSKLIVRVNGEKLSEIEDMERYNIEYSDELVVVRLPQGITIRFDGFEARVMVSKYYKNSVCGLCGHYDEDSEDEFRMNDNTITDDIRSFHKSYSMLEDSECQRRQADSVYEQSSLFERVSSRRSVENDDEESGFESDEDLDEYRHFDRRTENDEELDTEMPIKKTEIMEYGHKICFSLKPIKQCPKGTVPETTEELKVQFTCLRRGSTEARRLLREARKSDITSKLSSFKTSFVDTVKVHTTCTEY